MKLIKSIFDKYHIIIILILIVLFSVVLIKVAAISGGPFTPGETLNPDCVPGGTCYVRVFPADVAGVLTNNGTGTLSWEVAGGSSDVLTFRVAIPSADILTIGTIPIQLVPAPGVGKALQLINISTSIDYKTVAYTVPGVPVPGQLAVFANTATYQQATLNNILTSTVDRTTFGSMISTPGNTQTQIIENQPLIIKTDSGANPASGDGDIIIYGAYREITL